MAAIRLSRSSPCPSSTGDKAAGQESAAVRYNNISDARELGLVLPGETAITLCRIQNDRRCGLVQFGQQI